MKNSSFIYEKFMQWRKSVGIWLTLAQILYLKYFWKNANKILIKSMLQHRRLKCIVSRFYEPKFYKAGWVNVILLKYHSLWCHTNTSCNSILLCFYHWIFYQIARNFESQYVCLKIKNWPFSKNGSLNIHILTKLRRYYLY